MAITEELFQRLEQGDWETSLPLLKEYLHTDATPAEKGQIHVMVAQAYMKAATALNEQESAAINEILHELEDIDEKERKLDDASNLAQARSALK